MILTSIPNIKKLSQKKLIRKKNINKKYMYGTMDTIYNLKTHLFDTKKKIFQQVKIKESVLIMFNYDGSRMQIIPNIYRKEN